MARKYDDMDDFNLNDFDYDTEYDGSGSEEFSLESILAEYKGSAYIDGERKTPSGELDAKAEAIIRDVRAGKPLERDTSGVSVLETDHAGGSIGERRTRAHAKEQENSRVGIHEKESAAEFRRESVSGQDTKQRSAEATEKKNSGAYIFTEDDIYGQAGHSSGTRYDSREPADASFDEKRTGAGGLNSEEPGAYDAGSADGAASRDREKGNILSRIKNRVSSARSENTDEAGYDEASGGRDDDFDSDEVSPLRNLVRLPKLGFGKIRDKVRSSADSDGAFDYSAEPSGRETDSAQDDYRDRISVVDRMTDYVHRKKKEYESGRKNYEDYDAGEEQEPYVPEEEPSLKQESMRFAKGLASLAVRELIILGIGLVALIFNVLFEFGVMLPFGIGNDVQLLSGILLIMQLAVMALGIEIIISGVTDLAALEPGAESLVTLSSFVVAFDAALIVITGDVSRGLPYCVVSIAAMYFAVLGRKSYRLAMAETFRMAGASSTPSAVICDPKSIDNRNILKKVRSDLAGFWRMATASDVSEDTYEMASPILMAASLAFALLSTVFRGSAGSFLHAFASLLAVSASLSACIAYSVPFRMFTKRTRMSGGAIAGWRGAAEMSESDGVLVTDSDIFPKGTVSLGGVKMFERSNANRVIGYTGSVVMMSGSGLADVFDDFMRSRGINRVKVEKFSFYEGGGLGGRVLGENVLVGSSGFMNLMGIRVPDSVYEKNALFTAVNNRLVAVFTMNYAPSNSVRHAILSLLKSKVSMLFAAKDANLTPVMLQQKFKVSVDGIEYIPVEDCYRISADEVPPRCETLGVVCRSGLGPFASVICCAKKLKDLSLLLTIISVASSFIGLLYIFFLCWSGSFAVNTALNILLYLGVAQLVVYFFIFMYNRRH